MLRRKVPLYTRIDRLILDAAANAYFDYNSSNVEVVNSGIYITGSGFSLTAAGAIYARDKVQNDNLLPLKLVGGKNNAADAVAVSSNSQAAYTTPGALIHDFKNNDVSKVAFDKSGRLTCPTGTADAVVGIATLVAGTVTVNTTSVTASSKILYARATTGGTLGNLSAPVASIVAGTSFVINSSSGTETSTVFWFIIN